jgi:hypothetical protein
VHEEHFVALNARDRAALDPSTIPMFTCTGTADDVRARVHALVDAGATEIVYAPMGPDLGRELRAFRDAVL